MEKMRNFFKDESGATMVEYGLMVALIAVACITVRHNVAALSTSWYYFPADAKMLPRQAS